GMHDDYHRPTDTADRVNAEGMARVAAVADRIVARLDDGARPVYARFDPPRRRERGPAAVGAAGPFFGIGVDVRGDGDGVRVASVVPGSAAADAGVAAGDVIIRFGGEPVRSLADLQDVLRRRRVGDRVDVVFVRDGEARAG